MARNSKDFTFDAATQLKDAGAVTASAAAQVGGSARVLDLGAARTDARAIYDVSAIDVSSGDEKYELELQYSNDATFATGVVVGAVLKLGDSTTTGSSADSTTGRFELGVCNEMNGTTYRYCRGYHRIGGTTPSINYVAYMVVQAT